MKLRLAQPEMLIDINGLAELAYIKLDGDQLRIGALARHADLLDSAVAGQHFPIFHDAERVIADPIVRNWGTIGGSLCQADPSEDLSAAFAAARATAVIQTPDGERTVPVREFHLGPYETVVGRGRAADRDPGPDPARHRQRVREGGPPGRRLVDRRGRRGPVPEPASTMQRGGPRPDRGRRRALRRGRGRGLPARPRADEDSFAGRRRDRRRALPPRRRPARARGLQAAPGRRADHPGPAPRRRPGGPAG